MANPRTIKEAFERNKKAIELRPSIGKSAARTTIRVRNGTTCEIESGSKKMMCDVGTDAGGNDAGPGNSGAGCPRKLPGDWLCNVGSVPGNSGK